MTGTEQNSEIHGTAPSYGSKHYSGGQGTNPSYGTEQNSDGHGIASSHQDHQYFLAILLDFPSRESSDRLPI